MTRLTPAEIRAARRAIPCWRKRGGAIQRTFEFAGFSAAMKFVNAVARASERAKHHPDIEIKWNRVTLRLTTHDVDGLTAADFSLATRFDVLAG